MVTLRLEHQPAPPSNQQPRISVKLGVKQVSVVICTYSEREDSVLIINFLLSFLLVSLTVDLCTASAL